ncbi:R3H and coiled-coil domain-containing protein 1 [Cololabis saira]|uniref:R3H and coiled-coil domain-containing protein 1 n=1 Tax=Cololabis saira TaxID=129043 RepID=UPI002AD51D04|nr:R3H and coiled-coil domain-containing protein 1 [Cololabis saira]
MGLVLLSTLAVPCFDGSFLPKEESQFLHDVMGDLETYTEKSNRKSVLLFPPLPSRLRYLIHRKVEDLPELTSFSVGESWCRSVVVCHSELRVEFEDDSDYENNTCLFEELQICKEEIKANIKPKPLVPSRSRTPKRPDQPLYMPRAARERLTLQNPESSAEDKDFQSSDHCSSISIGSPLKPFSSPENTENTKYPYASAHEPCTSIADSEAETSLNSSALDLQEGRQQVATRLHESEDNEREDLTSETNSLKTENTETDDITEQIKAHLKEPDTVCVEHVHNDYSLFENVSFNADDFRHVIEIYGFPAFFKTDDLLSAFADYSDGGIKIKWVDNTHALGVFSSEGAAIHALSIHHPLLKARALSEGSKKAQGKAIRRAEFIQPVKERPRTDCAVAKRLVTRALGIREQGRVQRY